MKWFLIYVNHNGILTNKLIQANDANQAVQIANAEEE